MRSVGAIDIVDVATNAERGARRKKEAGHLAVPGFGLPETFVVTR